MPHMIGIAMQGGARWKGAVGKGGGSPHTTKQRTWHV